MSEPTNPTGPSDQNAQPQSAPKPTPTPQSTPPAPLPDTDNEGRHASPDEETAPEPAAEGEFDQAYLDKHASLKDRSGEGAPGDMSGVFTSTENPGAMAGDYSAETGRSQQAARESAKSDDEVTVSEK